MLPPPMYPQALSPLKWRTAFSTVRGEELSHAARPRVYAWRVPATKRCLTFTGQACRTYDCTLKPATR